MTISGKTRVCGVIGDPIEHTLSPIIHNAAFQELKIDYLFLAFRVKAAEVANAVNGMRALNIRGLNVTMPHKTVVVKHLDRVDLSAQIVNSVNTTSIETSDSNGNFPIRTESMQTRNSYRCESSLTFTVRICYYL